MLTNHPCNQLVQTILVLSRTDHYFAQISCSLSLNNFDRIVCVPLLNNYYVLFMCQTACHYYKSVQLTQQIVKRDWFKERAQVTSPE